MTGGDPRLFRHGDVRVTVDPDGFMLHPDDWTPVIAAAFAAADGLPELTAEHWRVVNYLRDYWLRVDRAPMVRLLCQETGCSLSRIYELFPNGPAHGACKYAGLPRPDGCV